MSILSLQSGKCRCLQSRENVPNKSPKLSSHIDKITHVSILKFGMRIKGQYDKYELRNRSLSGDLFRNSNFKCPKNTSLAISKRELHLDIKRDFRKVVL